MKKLIITLLILPVLIYSQDTSEIQVRPITPIDFYLSLFEHIDNLEKTSSLRSKSTVRNFSKLFSNNAIIFNDIVPSQNFAEQVSVREYTDVSKKLKRKRLSSRIKITQLNSDVTSLTKFSTGDKGSVSVNISVDKFMSFRDKSANLISNADTIIDFLDWPFNDNAIVELSYEIIIPKSDETIQEIKWKIDKISSLKTTHIRPNFYIPKTKIFLSKYNSKINADSIFVDNQSLFMKGEEIRYFTFPTKINRDMKIYIGDISENFIFKDVEKSNDFTYSLIFRQTQPTMLSFNIHLNENINTKTNSLKFINNDLSSSFSVSLTWLPYQINSENTPKIKKLDNKIDAYFNKQKLLKNFKKVTNLNIAVGLDFSIYNSNIISNSGNELIQNTFVNDIDFDGQSYTRISTISNYNENSKLNFLKIGPAINASIDFNRTNVKQAETNTWSFQVISKLSKGFNANITSSRTATANYSGEYEDFNLVIGDDEQFDRYNLGDYIPESNSDIELNAPWFLNFGIRVERIINLENIKEIGFFGGLSTTFAIGDFSAVKNQQFISKNSNELNSIFEVIDSFKLNSPLIFTLGISKKL